MQNQPIEPKPETETADTGAIRSKLYEMGFRFPLRYDLLVDNDVGFRRLAEAFGEGLLKYKPRNWKKGFPESVFINHIQEHLRLHLTGDQTEDHLAHACWNLYALMFVQERLPHLMDLTEKSWPPAPVNTSAEGLSPSVVHPKPSATEVTNEPKLTKAEAIRMLESFQYSFNQILEVALGKK